MNIDQTIRPRLSALEAAWVIARRDFVAVLFSRAFLFFLLGPLFPVLIGGLAGSIGGQVQRSAVSTEIGLALSAEDNAAMIAAADVLRPQLGAQVPELRVIEEAAQASNFDARAFLEAAATHQCSIVTAVPTMLALMLYGLLPIQRNTLGHAGNTASEIDQSNASLGELSVQLSAAIE